MWKGANFQNFICERVPIFHNLVCERIVIFQVSMWKGRDFPKFGMSKGKAVQTSGGASPYEIGQNTHKAHSQHKQNTKREWSLTLLMTFYCLNINTLLPYYFLLIIFQHNSFKIESKIWAVQQRHISIQFLQFYVLFKLENTNYRKCMAIFVNSTGRNPAIIWSIFIKFSP